MGRITRGFVCLLVGWREVDVCSWWVWGVDGGGLLGLRREVYSVSAGWSC